MTIALLSAPLPAVADSHAASGSAEMMDGQAPGAIGPGLFLPQMDAAEGRALFGAKGCAVCHSVNGIGGLDAPPLDAEFMDLPMNPFEFSARMWRGAEAMVALQREELGAPIELTGEELANIIAFVHDADEQKLFSEADIPEELDEMMHGMEGEEEEEDDDHR